MKSSEIKKIIKEITPQLNNSHWDIYKEALIIQPQNEILRGVYFNRSGLSKSQFELRYFAQPLYVPDDLIALSFGDNIKTPNNRQWWEYDSNKEISTQIAGLINKFDLDFFSKIRNAEDFYQYFKSNKKTTVRYFEAVSYSAAYAELKNAEDELKNFLNFLRKREEMKIDWVQQVYANTEKLLAGNMRTILKGWETETRKALKL